MSEFRLHDTSTPFDDAEQLTATDDRSAIEEASTLIREKDSAGEYELIEVLGTFTAERLEPVEPPLEIEWSD